MKSKTLLLSLFVVLCKVLLQFLKSQFSNKIIFAHFMMNSNNNDNDNDDSKSVANPHICIASTSENSCDYSLFNMHLVLNYTNNQIIYYYITDTISTTNQT